MHYPLTNIHPDFGINRPIRNQINAKRNYVHKRTDGQTDVAYDNNRYLKKKETTDSFFRSSIFFALQEKSVILSSVLIQVLGMNPSQ